MGAGNVVFRLHIASMPFTLMVRPAQFEQPTVLKVSFVRKHAASVVPKLPELPPVTSFGLSQGPTVPPPAVPLPAEPAELPPAPLELVPALPPIFAPEAPET